MEKKYALIIAFLITGIIVSDLYLFHILSESSKKSLQTFILSRVIDGDTLVLDDGLHVRLLNINAPEKGTHDYELSKSFLQQFENQSIKVQMMGLDKYSRSLARIYFNSRYLNLELVQKGFSSKFLVDQNELSLFDDAEYNAIKSSLGIWNKSIYFDCFRSSIDSKNEIVFIQNLCKNVGFSGWYLKDESRKVYFFNNLSFASINLHSFNGKDNKTDIYWNNAQDIWNNDRDSLYLFDKEGNLAHYQSYGY